MPNSKMGAQSGIWNSESAISDSLSLRGAVANNSELEKPAYHTPSVSCRIMVGNYDLLETYGA